MVQRPGAGGARPARCSTSSASGAKSPGRSPGDRPASAPSPPPAWWSCSPSWWRSTTWPTGTTSAGTSPPRRNSRCRTRRRRCSRGSRSRCTSACSTGRTASSGSASGSTNTSTSRSRSRSSTSTSNAGPRWPASSRCRRTAPSSSSTTGRTERVSSDGEQELTNGLIKVVQGKQHKVYLVQGHGEHKTEDSDQHGYSTIGQSLTSDNFEVASLVLPQVKEIPADASVLIVAGPKTDFFPAGDRHAEGVSREGRQGPVHARSARPRRRAGGHQHRGAAQGLGHRDRHQRRRRHQRHGPAARDGRVGAGGGEVPAAPDHGALRADHGLSAGPLGIGDHVGRERPLCAGAGQDQREQLGGNGYQGTDDDGPCRARPGQGRQGRPDLARGGGLGSDRRRRRRPTPAEEGRRPEAGDRASRCSATRTSCRTAGSASRATATCSSTP